MWQHFSTQIFTKSLTAPDMLQRVALGVMAFLTLMSFTLANVQALLWVNSDWLVSTVLPSVIVDLTNDEREDDAEMPLVRSAVLDDAAVMKAEHMATNGYFAHYSPDGISPWYWFDAAGYTFAHAGENLAVLFTDSEDVVNAWMDSPGHRANILNGNYTEIGVGTAKGTYKGKDTVFVVQLFGSRGTGVSLDPAARVSSDDRTGQSEAGRGGRDERHIAAQVPLLGPIGQEETLINENGDGEEVAAAEAHEEVPVIISDLASVSRDNAVQEPDTEPGFLGRFATQPQALLQGVYTVLALFVGILLVASIIRAFRKQETMHLVYGTGLLCLMAFLLAVHTAITGGATIL